MKELAGKRKKVLLSCNDLKECSAIYTALFELDLILFLEISCMIFADRSPYTETITITALVATAVMATLSLLLTTYCDKTLKKVNKILGTIFQAQRFTPIIFSSIFSLCMLVKIISPDDAFVALLLTSCSAFIFVFILFFGPSAWEIRSYLKKRSAEEADEEGDVKSNQKNEQAEKYKPRAN